MKVCVSTHRQLFFNTLFFSNRDYERRAREEEDMHTALSDGPVFFRALSSALFIGAKKRRLLKRGVETGRCHIAVDFCNTENLRLEQKGVENTTRN